MTALHMNIRLKLTLWYASAMLMILAVFSVVVVYFVTAQLYSDLDARLGSDYEMAEYRIFQKPNGLFDFKGEIHAEESLRVWAFDESGKLVLAFGVGVEHLPKSPSRHVERTCGQTLELDDGRWRACIGTHRVGSSDLTIIAARPEAPLRAQILVLALAMALSIPLGLCAAIAMGYGLARKALGPVDRMAERAKKISAENLSERLSVENPHDELGKLAATFNDTVARLERAFEELRRFTADASHELRTPLTAIRSVGEVGLSQPRSEQQYREIIGSMLEEVDRLTRLVDNLLTLARSDSGRAVLTPERVDLGGLARETALLLGVLAEEKHQKLQVEAEPGVFVDADRLSLRQALLNLIDNAIKYSPEGAMTTVIVRSEKRHALLEVRDEGPGVAAEHRGKIFERFYRVDKSRSRALGGAGLGLCIARRAVEANGGTLELLGENSKGCTFRISLPTKISKETSH